MKQAIPGMALVILLIALFSSVIYAFVSGAAWSFAVWFVSSDVAVSVFFGTLTALALVTYVVTQGKGGRR